MDQYLSSFCGVFYSVFDDIEGPKLIYQYPPEYIHSLINQSYSFSFFNE